MKVDTGKEKGCIGFIARDKTNELHSPVWLFVNVSVIFCCGLLWGIKEGEDRDVETQTQRQKSDYNMQTLLTWPPCRLQAAQLRLGHCVTFNLKHISDVAPTCTEHAEDDSCRVFFSLSKTCLLTCDWCKLTVIRMHVRDQLWSCSDRNASWVFACSRRENRLMLQGNICLQCCFITCNFHVDFVKSFVECLYGDI